MKQIIEILKTETQELKTQFIEKTAEWARNEFHELREWVDDYKNGKFGFGEASKKYYRLPRVILNANANVDEYISQKINDAEKHYENSIIKLASRIAKKGLNIDKLTANTSRIGVNIETTLTDGEKTVHAYTIVAWGEIQKPHYRYLIR